MWKKLPWLVIYILYSTASLTQLPGEIDSALVPVSSPHYQSEFNLDVPVNREAWSKQQPGLHTAFGSEDKLYFRSEVPGLSDQSDSWKVTAWKGERINAQILVWSPDTLTQIHFILGDLKNEKGKFLRKENIVLNKIAYVLSNYPYNANDVSCGEGPVDKAYLMPDRFVPLNSEADQFDLPARTVRPVWFSVNIPQGAEPGIYEGIIRIRTEKQQAVLKLKIKVQNQQLPLPGRWKFRLDLWQNPWVLSDYYQVIPWGNEHMALLKNHLKLYADAGGSFITTYAVHSPWADVTYHLDESMIEWVRTSNGSWKFKYDIFDRYVELCMSLGINKAITIYTPIPWGERFRFFDEKKGSYLYERWLPTSDTFKTNWHIFLSDLKSHLQKKGWFEKTYLGVNENAMEQTLSAIKVIKENSREWKITYAGDWDSGLDGLIDDYSSVFGKEPAVEQVKKRFSNHRTSTFYICCTPSKPNTFLFSPPVEARWLGWYAFAHHYDGFLRWAYDSWPADPVRDARHVYWSAGDCFLVYPGANSCIRFEKLREGIVDYEKIRIIRELAEKSSDRAVKTLLAELDAHIQKFNEEKDFKSGRLEQDIDQGKKMIEQLSEKLGDKR